MLLPFFQSSVLGLGAPLCLCPLELQRSRYMVERRRALKQSVLDSSFSLTLFFLSISLVWLPERICNGSIMVFWAFLFCVTTNAYWRILIRFSL